MKTITMLTVREETGFSAPRPPLVWGVPLPQGVAREAETLHLTDAAGRRTESEAAFLARWPDGSGKWALLAAPHFDIAPGATRTLRLAVGGPARGPGLVLRTTPAGVTVNTGALRFTLRRRGPLTGRIEARSGRAWRCLATGLESVMTVERDAARTDYFAGAAPRRLEIEVSGRLRAVVAVRGEHRSSDGRTFAPYVLRFEILAGRRDLRLTHSVIYDGDPERDFVRASELRLRARVGKAALFAFGADVGRETRFPRQRAPVWTPDFRHAELYQDSVTHWRLRRWVDLNRREVFCREGIVADGWMELAGAGARVAVAVREFAQNHPKALSADAATGEMRVGLYPARADRLDLRRYSDFVYPQMYEAPAYTSRKPIPFDKEHFNARGIRKTHDVLLMFNEPNPAATTLSWNRPLKLRWTPDYFADTGAVNPAARRFDRERVAAIHEWLDFLGAAMRREGGTGYLDYFDLPHSFDWTQGRWCHDYGGLGYCNDELLPCLGLWQAFFITGREDAFTLARAMTRHVMDVDCRHIGPAAGFGSRHNVNHWGDQCHETRISQPIGKRFLYYLTGDRSVLDLAQVFLAATTRRFTPARVTNGTCDAPAIVSNLLFARETGLADTTEWLRRIADALAEAVDETGRMAASVELDAARRTARPVPGEAPIRLMMFGSFGGPQTYIELAETLDHEPLRGALTRFLRYQLQPRHLRRRDERVEAAALSDRWATTILADLVAYVWTRTGDAALAARARAHLREPRLRLLPRPEARYGRPGAASRPAPFVVPWPDLPAAWRRRFRECYPLFEPGKVAQFTALAGEWHKMQSILLLLDSGRRLTRGRHPSRSEPG